MTEQATVIYQPNHSKTGFCRVADHSLRWASGGMSTKQNNYKPQPGDRILMDFGANRNGLEVFLTEYGLERGRCIGGTAYELLAIGATK